MTRDEQKIFRRGLVAGAAVGLAAGLLVALFIAMRPETFAAMIP